MNLTCAEIVGRTPSPQASHGGLAQTTHSRRGVPLPRGYRGQRRKIQTALGTSIAIRFATIIIVADGELSISMRKDGNRELTLWRCAQPAPGPKPLIFKGDDSTSFEVVSELHHLRRPAPGHEKLAQGNRGRNAGAGALGVTGSGKEPTPCQGNRGRPASRPHLGPQQDPGRSSVARSQEFFPKRGEYLRLHYDYTAPEANIHYTDTSSEGRLHQRGDRQPPPSATASLLSAGRDRGLPRHCTNGWESRRT